MDKSTFNAVGVDLTVVERLAVAAQHAKQLEVKPQVLVVPMGYRTETLPSIYDVELPSYIRQNVVIVELASFVSYVKQFATHTARIFGNTASGGAHFVAILDYHEGGKEWKPGRSTHKVSYDPSFSEEFGAWYRNNGKPNTQEAFLEHLRKWGYVVTSHTDADLIELASSLEFTSAGQFASKIERTRGGRQLVYNEQVEGSGTVQGKTVTVPDKLSLKMPVYLGGREYEFEADLLYRVSGGRLTIAWEIQRAQKLVFEATKDLVSDIEEGTEISVFVGEVVT